MEDPGPPTPGAAPTDHVTELDNPAPRTIVPLTMVDTNWGGVRAQETATCRCS